MNESTFIVTAFVDAEFEMFRIVSIVDGKQADKPHYVKSGTELLKILRA